MTNNNKWCYKCKTNKSASEFDNRKKCNTCYAKWISPKQTAREKAYHKKYYLKNVEKLKKKNAEWRKKAKARGYKQLYTPKPPRTEKYCSGCQKILPLSNFLIKNKEKGYRYHLCENGCLKKYNNLANKKRMKKPADKQYRKEYYQKNKERISAQSRKYYKRKVEAEKLASPTSRESTGITGEAISRMLVPSGEFVDTTGFDMMVGGTLRIEVKTSSWLPKYQGWKFKISPAQLKIADFALLIALTPTGDLYCYWLIPSSQFAKAIKFKDGNLADCKYKKYLVEEVGKG